MASPANVTIHTQLVYSGLECSPENTDAMSSDVEQAARHLVTAKVDVIADACTGGRSYKRRMESLSSPSRGPAVAKAYAAVQALESLGLQNVSVATPHPERINQWMGTYYRQAGFNVRNVDGEP